RARCRHLLEDAMPDAPLRPAMVAVVDCLCGAVFGWNVPPSAADLQDVKDAGDDPAVIDPRLAGLSMRQVRFERRPCLVREPKQRLFRHSLPPILKSETKNPTKSVECIGLHPRVQTQLR